MSYPISTRGTRDALGNSDVMVVHNLRNEDVSADGCQIDEIIAANHAVGFSPDTLAQAHNEGYRNCQKCC